MGDITPDSYEEFREILAERKRRLWADVRDDLFRSAGERLHGEYDIPQDVGDSSILDLLADAGIAVAEIRKEELTQLEEAQRRLEMGAYGKCEMCGEPIGAKRLSLLPYAIHCVRCQKQLEGASKPPGTTL